MLSGAPITLIDVKFKRGGKLDKHSTGMRAAWAAVITSEVVLLGGIALAFRFADKSPAAGATVLLAAIAGSVALYGIALNLGSGELSRARADILDARLAEMTALLE